MARIADVQYSHTLPPIEETEVIVHVVEDIEENETTEPSNEEVAPRLTMADFNDLVLEELGIQFAQWRSSQYVALLINDRRYSDIMPNFRALSTMENL
jgi:hypothetical protein